VPESRVTRAESRRSSDGTTTTWIEDVELRRLLDSNEDMAQEILALRRRIPTDEEMAYLRNRKEADERAAWAWRMLRTYVPWVASIGTALGTAAYWLVTHFQWRGPGQ
jgi:hypothetical protein